MDAYYMDVILFSIRAMEQTSKSCLASQPHKAIAGFMFDLWGQSFINRHFRIIVPSDL